MAVEKTYPAPVGEPEEVEVEVHPEAVLVEDTDDGGVEITLVAGMDVSAVGFYDNLAEFMDEAELTRIGADVVEMAKADKLSRRKWEEAYIKGLELLGLEIEEASEPFEGACGVFHPMLIEAVVRFQAHAVMETFPASGPVKTKIVGKVTPEKQKQSSRIKEDMNYISTEKMPEYRDEHERLLVNLPLAGSAFKKIFFDGDRERPVAEFVPAEDLIVSYGTTNIMECSRLTHLMREPTNVIKRRIRSGIYRDVGDVDEPSVEIDDVDEATDSISGETTSIQFDDRHRLYEMQCELELDAPFGEQDGIARPYIVTVMQDGRVLSLRRNWVEGDPKCCRRQHFSHYNYLPGLGFYGIGLIHLIGGLAKASTQVLRQLVDAGMFANIPAGFKAKGFRVKGGDEPFKPGEWRDVDIPGDDIRKSMVPLPYKEPSTVLLQLLQGLVEEGRKLGSIADVDIKNIGADTPVGTTLALMERSLKIMSAVQSRLHKSMSMELKILSGLIRDHMPAEYPFEVDEGATRAKDYDGRVDVVPVSDPNATTMAQKVIQNQAAMQASASAPNIYNMRKLHRSMLDSLEIQNADEIVPLDEDMTPKDPVAENMAILKMEPVKVFEYQDHRAHIVTHMSAMNDPQIKELVGQNPNASAIQSALMAHVTEHVAYEYRREMEKAMGTHLPPLDQPLPPDVEASLAPLLAQASGKVLSRSQQEAQKRQAEEQAKDPVVQLQMREMALKERRQAFEEQLKQEELALERDKMDLKGQTEGAKLGAQVASKDKDRASKENIEGMKAGMKVMEDAAERLEKEKDRGAAAVSRNPETE